MKLMAFVGCVLVMLMQGCGDFTVDPNAVVPGYDPHAEFDPQLEIDFPDKGTFNTLPFRSGGEFTVRLKAVIPHLSCKPVDANVDMVALDKPEGARVSARATLIPLDLEKCEDLSGDVKLSWPGAGKVQVRATLAGTSKEETISFDPLSLVIQVDTDTGGREGLGFRYPFCVESSSVGGNLELRLKNATLLGDGDVTRLPLKVGTCKPEENEPRRASHFKGELLTSSAEFDVGAALVGTTLVADPQHIQARYPGVLQLRVEPSVETLPDAGSVVDVTVVATLGGAVAAGIPIRLEVVPDTELLPVSGLTDAQGLFRASILVPKDTLGMRIDAVAGSVRSGKTLATAP
ncbi:hypothetical protein [Corallococcus exercitus]|uniref:Uncharacterized protein n=1 Tax=Corallococcus exercitus TaxID=2316736 RepID=A0A7Y4NCP4_9BACT|nr:hypothetical protein [Corallococcus exercitus]NOK08020.1 hypothetical protein [Corallococcus exercitus]